MGMRNDLAFGSSFMLSAGTRWRAEGGYEMAPEYGFTLVARAGLVRASRGRRRRFDLAAVAPILAAALMTASCSVLPSGRSWAGVGSSATSSVSRGWLASIGTTASCALPATGIQTLTR